MGAQSFIARQKGPDASKAFQLAQETAVEEYGNDIYNGTISTCHTFRDITSEFRRSGKTAKEFINDKIGDMGKRDCYVICEMEAKLNTNKIRSFVQHTVVKGTSKWELRYNVYTGSYEERQLNSFKTKGDAVEYARKHTEKTQDTTFVRMEKFLSNQDPNVACIKYKPSPTEKDGQYLFFGMAAC
jgi:hypothetical protein